MNKIRMKKMPLLVRCLVLSLALCLFPVFPCVTAQATGLAPLEKLGDRSYKAIVAQVEWLSANAVLRATTPNQMVLTTTYVLRNNDQESKTVIMGLPKAPYKGQSLGEPVITIDGEKSEFRTVKMTESPDGQEGEDNYITWYTFSMVLDPSETKGFDISYIIIPDIESDGTYTAKLPLALNRFWEKAPEKFTLTVLLPGPYSLDPAPSVPQASSRREDGAYVWELPGNSSPDFFIHLKDPNTTMQRYFSQIDETALKDIYAAYTKRNISQFLLLCEEYLTTTPALPHVNDVNYLKGLTYWMMGDRVKAMESYDQIDLMGFGTSANFMANKLLFDRYNHLLSTDLQSADYLLQTQPANDNVFFEGWIRHNAPGPAITPTPPPTETPEPTAPTASIAPQASPAPEKAKWPFSPSTTVVLLVLILVVAGCGVFLYLSSRRSGKGQKRRVYNNMRHH